jgi:3'-phosphoadenosine 5'-phosphosulfate sulfotransferase (PAPS reductase)/FAD synthetase
MNTVKQVLGISGGKDSAALAVYLHQKYPSLEVTYYNTDTGKELEETYQLIQNLENYLGKNVDRLKAADSSQDEPFDHFLRLNGNFLPSPQSRWCTGKLKIVPFEEFVGDAPTISYVGIRGDEEREGYVSKKSNIQAIFPFRKNIWSEEVITRFLTNSNIEFILEQYAKFSDNSRYSRMIEVIKTPISLRFNRNYKLNTLLDLGIKEFNHATFAWLKTQDYPISQLEASEFPLLDNEEILVKQDIFDLLRNSGVGVPKYYEEVEFEVNGKKGVYNRSRSGCFFCFYQQRIEWVWLYEQHPDKFYAAIEYEKEGYTWIENERLEDLIKPERIIQIKEEHLAKFDKKSQQNKSNNLIDILDDDTMGCVSCFI